MDPLISALRKYYGWNAFKQGQRPVIEAILAGEDVLVVLPTGGGKSLCYQLPALMREGLVVVISPLVALMEDQIRYLQNIGIEAYCLHSGLDIQHRKQVMDSLRKNRLRLLYLAPERLRNASLRKLLNDKTHQKEIVAIAVDEAHCISSWGHDFRPDYRRLGEIRNICPGVPLVALSATAAPQVRADIIRLLSLSRPFMQVCSAQRKNLSYSMRRRSNNPLPELIEALASTRGASLIYVRTRRSVEQWTEVLKDEGIAAIPYHAGLNYQQRQDALSHFIKKNKPVLVATVAFGMGVDRSDVGLVLHLDLPSTPEGYLQQSGRAGRDGLPANCMVWFSPGDRIRLGWALKPIAVESSSSSRFVEEEDRREMAQEQLRRMEAIAEGDICLEQSLLLSVGELVPPCGRCDRCKSFSSQQNWSLKAKALLDSLQNNDGKNIRNIVDCLPDENLKADENWSWLARRLVQENLIKESNDGTQTLFIKESGRRFLKDPWPLNYATSYLL